MIRQSIQLQAAPIHNLLIIRYVPHKLIFDMLLLLFWFLNRLIIFSEFETIGSKWFVTCIIESKVQYNNINNIIIVVFD